MSRIKLLNCDERNILQYNLVLWLTVVFSTVYYCSYVKQYPMGLLIHKLNRFDTFVFAKTFDFYFEITPNFTFYFTAMRQVKITFDWFFAILLLQGLLQRQNHWHFESGPCQNDSALFAALRRVCVQFFATTPSYAAQNEVDSDLCAAWSQHIFREYLGEFEDISKNILTR
jgi:hypothetical protein